MDARYKKLTKNTIVYSLGIFGSKFVAFFLVPLYTNVLTQAEYGVADLITTISGLLLPLFSLSLGESILFFGIRSKDEKTRDNYFKTGLLLVLATCLVLVLFSKLFLLYGSIREYVAFLIGYSILEIIRNYFRCFAKAQNKNLVYSIDCIIYVVVIASFSILFLLVMRYGIQGYLWAFIIAELASIVFLALFNKGVSKLFSARFDENVAIEMLKYSLPLILNSISWTIANQSDKIMLDYLISSDSVGLYTAASKIPTMLSTIAGLFCQAWTISTYLEISNQDRNFYSKIFQYFSFAMLLCCSAVLVVTRPFMRVFVGAAFQESVIYVPLLVIATIFQSYATYFGAIIQSSGKNLFMMISTVSSALINLVLNYFLIINFGIQGACLSTAISFLAVFVMRYFFSKRSISFSTKPIKMAFSILLIVGEAIAVIYNYHCILIGLLVTLAVLVLNVNPIIDLFKFISKKISKRKNA